MRRAWFAAQVNLPSAVVALAAIVALPGAVRGENLPLNCDAPFAMIRFANPLMRVAEKLKTDKPITVVAIGSSSTAGSGASSPATSYPSRLAYELMQRFPGHSITVLNRGVGGDEVDDMVKRFDTAVVAAKPDLVLWQFGTNSIIRDDNVSNYGAEIHEGLAKIRSIGADVALIDPQFAPKVVVKQSATHMVELMSGAAKNENIDLFPRFNVMKRWHDVDRMDFSTFVSSDGLHMNDWGYGCMAKALSLSIAEAAERPIVSAHTRPAPLAIR